MTAITSGNDLYGTYDTSGRFSWWFADDDYEAHHSSIFFIATRGDEETDDEWRERAIKLIETYE